MNVHALMHEACQPEAVWHAMRQLWLENAVAGLQIAQLCLHERNNNTVTSLCNDCICSQEDCPYIKLSLLRDTTVVKVQ